MFDQIKRTLAPQLSRSAEITPDAPSRWSAYAAPKAVATVYPDCEDDVAATIKYCNAHNIRLLTRNGGNGWTLFPSDEPLVMLSLAKLNSVTVSSDKKTAVIGGGAKVKETIDAADAAGVIVMTGNCNGVGTLGAFLGGGMGATMGMYGYGVDSILSMRVVTADGEIRTVSATQEGDLFWAMRGAGPNFGVVTSATVKAYPMAKDERSAWKGMLIFEGDKLERVIAALEELKLQDRMVVLAYLASSGPPANTPAIVLDVWLLQGTVEAGHEAFKALFDIGPMVDTTAVTAYPDWNTGADMFCTHAGRKPCFAAGFSKLDPTVWRKIWDVYTGFQKQPGAQNSSLLLEIYPMNELRFAGEKDAAAALRRTRYQSLALWWYDDAALDAEAERTGKEVRELLRSCRSEKDVTYVNLARGDEPLEELYGDSLPRLKEVKRKWDPQNRFNQWYNIPVA